MTARLRTANYSQEARTRLGDAVAKAREAAGYRWRTEFARAAEVSVRSLVNLEQGKPGIGQSMLYAVARALPAWTEDTPRQILERGTEAIPTIPERKTAAISALEEPAPAADDRGIDEEMLAHLMLVRDTIAESEAPLELINELIRREFQLWRPRVQPAIKFLRTWLMWTEELAKIGVRAAEGNDPYRTG